MLIQWVGFPVVLLEAGLFHTTYTYFASHISSIIEANEIFNKETQKLYFSQFGAAALFAGTLPT